MRSAAAWVATGVAITTCFAPSCSAAFPAASTLFGYVTWPSMITAIRPASFFTERPVKKLAGRIAVIIDGQVTYPWRVLAAGKAAEQLGAKQVVIATPVATQAAADRIAVRRYDFVCPSIVMDAKGHPAPYGDVAGETPERLRSIMIAHQAA